jgi:hypothetical protein
LLLGAAVADIESVSMARCAAAIASLGRSAHSYAFASTSYTALTDEPRAIERRSSTIAQCAPRPCTQREMTDRTSERR